MAQQANPPTTPQLRSMTAIGPDGKYHVLTVDSNGNIPTGGAVGQLGPAVDGYVPPVAIQGLGSDGKYHTANVDSNGNLKTQGNTTANAIPSGLIAWYPLTEATGTAPQDISGNGNNATLPGGSNNPTSTLNGWLFRPDTPSWFILPSTVYSAGLTYVAHLCPYVNTTSLYPPAYDNPTFASSDTSGGLILGQFSVSPSHGAWMPNMGPSTSNNTTGTTDISTGCHVYTYELGVSPTQDRIFVDGNEVNYSNHGSSGGSRGIGTMYIGGSSIVQTPGHFAGTIRDIWIFNRDLSTSEVQAFAQTAWAIASDQGLLKLYPGNGLTSTVTCIGDSVIQGANVTNAGCSSVLMIPTETISIHNYGTAGLAMADLLGTAVSVAYPNYSTSAEHNTVVLEGCGNDIANANRTPQACFAMLEQVGKSLRAKGFKVIRVPMLDGGAGAFNSQRDTFLALENANWQDYADAYISPTDPHLWADSASANATYFQSDTLHPTQLGQNLLGTYLTNVYNKLYGSTQTNWNTTSAATYTIQAADSYLAVTANSTLTLPSCTGYSGSWNIKVNPGLTATLKTASSTQTIDGTDYSVTGLSLTAGDVSSVVVVPSAPATATCTWRLTQK